MDLRKRSKDAWFAQRTQPGDGGPGLNEAPGQYGVEKQYLGRPVGHEPAPGGGCVKIRGQDLERAWEPLRQTTMLSIQMNDRGKEREWPEFAATKLHIYQD